MSQKCCNPSKLQNKIKKDYCCSEVRKKCFFLRKLTKININSLFIRILKIFICVRVTQVAFLSEEWKSYPSEAASSLSERKAYRKQTIKCVCPSQQGIRFRAWPIHAGFTVHCLVIICKYLSLSHKPDYERSGLNTYQFVSLFQWFK